MDGVANSVDEAADIPSHRRSSHRVLSQCGEHVRLRSLHRYIYTSRTSLSSNTCTTRSTTQLVHLHRNRQSLGTVQRFNGSSAWLASCSILLALPTASSSSWGRLDDVPRRSSRAPSGLVSSTSTSRIFIRRRVRGNGQPQVRLTKLYLACLAFIVSCMAAGRISRHRL